jgi:DNA replication protein DnaC
VEELKTIIRKAVSLGVKVEFATRIAGMSKSSYYYHPRDGKPGRKPSTHCNKMIGTQVSNETVVEEINFDASRSLDKALMTDLATCNYITKGESILITGATGSGKSFFASTLGHQACAHGHTAAYFNTQNFNTQKFMLRVKMARLEGNILKFFDKIAKISLFILDDFGLTNLERQHQLDLMEIIEDRHGKSSAIIGSQIPVAN